MNKDTNHLANFVARNTGVGDFFTYLNFALVLSALAYLYRSLVELGFCTN